jgi:hypothetical protein
VEKAFQLFGRTLVLAGVVPALLWIGLNVILFGDKLPRLPLGQQVVSEVSAGSLLERAEKLLDPAELGWTMVLAVTIGGLLFACNGPLIRWYEGIYPIQRRWLLAWAQRHNERLHDRLYGRLITLRGMRAEALTALRAADGFEPSLELRRRADATLVAIEEVHAGLETRQPVRALPLRREFVRPTALGNAYAVMEEYPFERYGMDSLVFWPRLLAALPKEFREGIGDQKTTCDFMLNCSVLLTLFALEAAVATVAPTTGGPRLVFLAALVIGALIAYGLYRATVAETVVLGTLIASGFDLYRHELLRQFGIVPPARLADERDLWLRLSAFVRRGDDFYFPAAPTPDQVAAGRA